MITVIPKNIEYKAIKFINNEDQKNKLHELCGKDSIEIYPKSKFRNYAILKIVINKKLYIASENDWILIGEKNNILIIKPDEFTKKYKKLDRK